MPPRLMGIVNVTPDSFYAGSRASGGEALDRALRMVAEGADILDVGGESTRPGAEPVSAEEESRRVLPLVEALARRVKVPISIDTSKAEVARRALGAGASMLNDVTALRGDPGMTEAALDFPHVVLMHMIGTPKTMQKSPAYGDVVREILGFLEERAAAFAKAGGERARLLLDPGIGFGKDLEHNLEILRRLAELKEPGLPLVVGASRKSFIGRVLGGEGAPLPPEERLEGSLAVACRAALAGADVLRVHDVLATRRALDVFLAVS